MRPPIRAIASVCGLALSAAPALAQGGRGGTGGPALEAAIRRVFPPAQPRPAPPPGGPADTPEGPDLIVGEVHSSDAGPGGGSSPLALLLFPFATSPTHFAYGLGTTACNTGSEVAAVPHSGNLLWLASPDNRHPVIAQNLYRLSTVNGATRLEQVGQSWVKHAFFANAFSACGSCNGEGGTVLGAGCSDPYTASRNAGNTAQQNGALGPRYHVNPFTGSFPAPFTSPPPPYQPPPAPTDTLVRRLRIARADLSITTPSSLIQFFAEALYISRDDAAFGHAGNNASYRRAFCTDTATGAITLEGSGAYGDGIHRQLAAVYAWRDYGAANAPDPAVMISETGTGGAFDPGPWGSPGYPAAPQGDGIHLVASRATDLGNGTWHYEYAVENITSDRAGGSFSVPVPSYAAVTNIEWHGVDSHGDTPANDATRNAPWISHRDAAGITWSAPVPYDGTGANQFLGNCIRWGTLYNFRFDCNRPPAPSGTGLVTLGLYKPMPGYPASVTAAARVPAPITCYPNCDNSTTPPILNVADFTCFLQKFAAADPFANCDASTTPPTLNVADFTCFLQSFAAGCP